MKYHVQEMILDSVALCYNRFQLECCKSLTRERSVMANGGTKAIKFFEQLTWIKYENAFWCISQSMCQKVLLKHNDTEQAYNGLSHSFSLQRGKKWSTNIYRNREIYREKSRKKIICTNVFNTLFVFFIAGKSKIAFVFGVSLCIMLHFLFVFIFCSFSFQFCLRL